MYFLSDIEIKNLAKETEEFVLHQRKVKHLFQINEKTKSFLIDEDAKILAVHMLTHHKIHHTYDDVLRLSIAIEKNITNMNWFNNKC